MVRTLPRPTLEQLPTLVQVEHGLATLTSEQLKAASLKNPCTLKSFVSKAKQDKDTKPARMQAALQNANADSAWSETYSKATSTGPPERQVEPLRLRSSEASR